MQTTQKKQNTPTIETRRELPKNWRKVAGILRGRKKLLEKHVNTVRNEWK